jgi:hypothetical protein
MSRYLLVGTLATAVTLFVWQSISNTAIPWHSASMHPITPAAVQAVHTALPENGLYGANEGIIAVVHTTPDMRDLTKEMGLPLARQIVIDLLAALVLGAVVLRLPRRGALVTGVSLALVSAAFTTILSISDWNWYGYPFLFELVNVIDLAIQGLLAGLILGWAVGRFAPAEATTPDRATAAP